MPAIQQQQRFPINETNLSVTQGFSISSKTPPSLFSITSVQPSQVTLTSAITPSGISDSQGSIARTAISSTFLTAIGAPTKGSTQKAAAFDANAAASPSTMSRSVTAKARVATQTDSNIRLSEHTHLPAGVKHIATCLNDYYTQHAETTTHKLINICANNTQLAGYVEPKCNVNQPKENQINAYKLNKIGDMYTAETKNSKGCEQPILTRPAPEKIGECFYVSTTYNDDLFADNRMVINACDKAVKGHVEKGCLMAKKPSNSWGRFTLEKQGDTHVFVTEEHCRSPIREGDRPNPPTRSLWCVDHYITKNGNGTTTITVGNECLETLYPFIEKGCTVAPPSLQNEWSRFTLPRGRNYTVLLHDKPECDQPFHHWEEPPDPTSYAKRFCPPEGAFPTASFLVDVPKAEKIIGGENVPTVNARHLVYVGTEIGYCTGSLISERHVLTSAHCIKDARHTFRPSYIDRTSIWHDPYPRKDTNRPQFIPITKYKVKAAHISPCYGLLNFSSCDLAILELTQPVLNGRSVPLPTKEDFCEFTQAMDEVLKTDFSYSADKISGNFDKSQSVWQKGNALSQGFGLEKNLYGRIREAGRAKQERVVAYKLKDDDKVIVTQQRNNGGVICHGDSGGPLLFETKDGRKVQIGVTSGFDNTKPVCDEANSVVFSTNVHSMSNRQWIQARLAENSDTTVIKPKDLTRLRVSPDSCVVKIDKPSGFVSWLGSFMVDVYGDRRITFTNNCHNKNHPAKVNVKFYSVQGQAEKLEMVNEQGKKAKAAQLDVGETRVIYTDGTPSKVVLGWSDVDEAIGINSHSSDNVKRKKKA